MLLKLRRLGPTSCLAETKGRLPLLPLSSLVSRLLSARVLYREKFHDSPNNFLSSTWLRGEFVRETSAPFYPANYYV